MGPGRPEEEEAALRGGRTTAGVARVGETVRRPPAPNAGFVRALLHHLEAAGFSGAPRYLGIDGEGRELFSFITGDVPAELGDYDDETLRAAARLIRDYHDATAPLLATDAARSVGLEVACHNDLSPCNAVFRDGRPVALIDFDASAPGSRAHDLGYAAWLWLDLGNPDHAPPEQRRRFDVFRNAYGDPPSREKLIAAILDRQAMLAAGAMRSGDAALRDWATACRVWTLAHML